MFVLILLCVLSKIVMTTASCSLNTFTYCQSWSACSKSCGGGTRSRLCKSNFCNLYQNVTVYENCREKCLYGHPFLYGRCQCPSWRTGTCCEACRHINIQHCISGQQSCGGTPDGIKCTQCQDPYYSAGYNNGCRVCTTIDYCLFRHCTNSTNTVCTKCENNTGIYRLSADRKACIHDVIYDVDDYTGILAAIFVLLVIVCMFVPVIYAAITRRLCFKTQNRGSINGHKISPIPSSNLPTLDY